MGERGNRNGRGLSAPSHNEGGYVATTCREPARHSAVVQHLPAPYRVEHVFVGHGCVMGEKVGELRC
jgi:hypothetical protein